MEKYTLVGVNGNAFAIMGYVIKAMKETGKSKEEIDTYQKEAMSSDYDNLISVSVDEIDAINEKQINK